MSLRRQPARISTELVLWERVWLSHQGVSETWDQSEDLHQWEQTTTQRSSSLWLKIWIGTKGKAATKFLLINLAFSSKTPTEYQGWLNTKLPVLIRRCSERVCTLGMHWEIQRGEAKWWSRLNQGTQGGRREGLQHQALQRSPCGLLGNDELNHQFAALQHPGKMREPVVFRLTGPSPASHMENPGMRSLRVSSTLPCSAACQKCSDPRVFAFMEKCWNLAFIPIWNETRFCNIKILHKMKCLFIAQLYWLMQTACNWAEPAKWVFQSEFPGLSLPRRQFTARPRAAVLQEGGGEADGAQHWAQQCHTVPGCCCWWDSSGEVCPHPAPSLFGAADMPRPWGESFPHGHRLSHLAVLA